MEHLLARRIKNGNIDVLKKNMGKPELIRYDWSNTVAELIMVLNLFSLTTPPAEGVQHIVKSIQCIQNGIQLAMPGKQAGADELIPTTIFCWRPRASCWWKKEVCCAFVSCTSYPVRQ